MLQKALAPTHAKKNTPLNPNIDLKDYHLYVANHFLELDIEACKEMFCLLIKYIDIKEIEKSPVFLAILAKVRPFTSPQEVFDRVATGLVSTNSLENLKFLLKTFDLRKLTTNKGSTLLHLACAHENRQEMIVHLVEVGFDVNAQTLAQKSPIHDLVMFDQNAFLIPIFEKKGANLNVLNQSKMTPLHIAAVRQNSECMKKLFACKKVDRKIKHNGRTYLQLAEGAKQGTLKLTLPVVNFTAGSPEGASEALFYKALFSNKLRQDYFKTCATFFEKKVTLEPKEQELFFYAHIFSRALTEKIIKKFFSTHVQSGKVDKSIFLFLLGVTAKWLTKQKPAGFESIVNTLCEMQLNLLEKMDPSSVTTSEQIKCYINLSSWFTIIHLPAKGKDAANRGLCVFTEGNNDLRAALFHNQATNQIELLDFEGALKSSENAFRLNNSENEFFFRYFSSLLNVGDYETAKRICDASNCPEYSRWMLLFAKYLLSEVSASEALKELDHHVCEESSLKTMLLDFQRDCYLRLDDFEKAFSAAQKSFLLSEASYENGKSTSISVAMGKFLEACSRIGKYQEGLDSLKTWQVKYSMTCANSIFLKGMQFILYLKAGQLDLAEQLLQELSQSKIDSNYLCDLWINLALHQDDSSKILSCLENALKTSPNSKEANFYKELVLLLTADAVVSNDTENLVVAEEITDLPENDVEDQDTTEHWDPKQIHLFFQEQKKKALSVLQHKLLQTTQPKGVWKVGETVYQEGDLDLFPLNSPLYPDHYVVIDRILMFDKKYCQALQKGLCDRASGQDGLKVLCNTLAELKLVGENTRLYAVKVYQNGNKSLIVLDKTGNHLKIKRELKARKCLEVVDVSSASEAYWFSELPNHGSDKPKPFSHKTHSEEPTSADSFLPIFAPSLLLKNDGTRTEALEKDSTPSSNC